MDALSERLDIQRLGVVAINAVAPAPQAGEVTQNGLGGGGGQRSIHPC